MAMAMSLLLRLRRRTSATGWRSGFATTVPAFHPKSGIRCSIPSSQPSQPEKALALAFQSLTTSLSSNIRGLLKSIRCPESSPRSELFCREPRRLSLTSEDGRNPWRDQGKVQQARELLAPVFGWFTEGFDTRDLNPF